MIIAIDGPSGSGKSSTAKVVAKRLGYLFIDTGAMFRAVTWAMLERKLPMTEATAKRLLREFKLKMQPGDERVRVWVDTEEVTDAIRTPTVTENVSLVSSWASVRDAMLTLQRQLAVTQVQTSSGAVLDGRDIGTVVFPHADVKIFMIASPEVRAKRRHAELAAKGIDQPYADVLADLIERDRKDSSRAIAPLKQAEDAILLDTSGMSFEDQVEFILSAVAARNAG
ncbi:MAG: (d)CMP kinase [Rhodothermales bacterium]